MVAPVSIALHLFAERRVGKRWVLAEPPVFDQRVHWEDGEKVYGPSAKPRPVVDPIAPNRELSAVLCGLGHSWIEGDVEPIVSPRGLPADMSEGLRVWCRTRRSVDEYVTGWMTLDEFLAYDWDQPVTRTAFVDPQHAHLFPDPPKRLTDRDWARIGASRVFMRGGSRTGVRVRWIETRRDLAWRLFDDAIPRLVKMDVASKLRFVFWHS